MRSKPSKAFATRLPAEEAQRLETVIESTGKSRAEIIRRAVRYYLAENPDEIPAVYPTGSMNRFWAELME